MLSYRHAFHAGNHADVLKHYIQTQILSYFNQKDKSYWYIDTHSGAGVYSLTEGYATKNAEFESGIARLWERDDLPESIAEYVDVVKALNPDGKLNLYPGSPYVADQLLRPTDRLRLFELHSSDSKILKENFAEAGRRVAVIAGDGFAGIKAVLPPPPRRGVTLIDPPYEDKNDYDYVINMLHEALSRFATGTYAIWYPQLQRAESKQLPEELKKLGVNSWLHVALSVQSPSADGFGMHGSGMFILNPPWTLAATLRETMPYLVKILGQGKGAKYILEEKTA
ncbi:23S rRNA (adenine(2030)-N(6))-methyltransferase RlmJ [Iodobacter fluviatilis]|uniref:Ribosomal RNA large subunit methyltransferase J n=1 Tax=Iodobacter fluviatilis TaxID=537 RepID=A0A377SYN2_9NEIS|nr:23S rRNA (adenine(2030)-N(6))-methyltransferase RlmJ [Iodobacter fluviatilis]TCU88119.1 23S rRNA (adenine2030-N6)-methyltransferase [Iodobacter fluviatilis]STR45619.1 Protein involved in catabolism of external DNA [Iodobacter fluviatilis]